MAFNRSDYVKIKKSFEDKKRLARERSDEHIREVCTRFPEMRVITAKLAATGPRIYDAAVSGGEDLEKKLAEIRAENEVYLAREREILLNNGYPEDYLDVKYECPVCGDEGNVQGRMCECMRKQLILAGYESAGIAALVGTHDFESFDLSYYKGDERVYTNMKYVFDRAKGYAEGFNDLNDSSLLFFGGTGLGKTHLSVAVAKRVIERGYYVVYDTAQNIFSDFEYERFGRTYSDNSPDRTARYFECDLLIIDDLGTEIKSQAVTAFLYNLINTRLCSGKQMIINTNLTSADMFVNRYDERIASRLLGEFKPYRFTGKDVRMQKLQM